jgi:hypothetical protein
MRGVGLLALMSLSLACGQGKPAQPAPEPKGQQPSASSPSKPPAPAEPSVGLTGVIEGQVVLAEGAKLPELEDPRKAAKFALTDPPQPCSPIGKPDLTPVRRDADSAGLSNIHVALTGMRSTPDSAPRVHELLLTDCRLAQPVLGVMRGDTVRIKNASGSPLLPAMPGDKFMQAILPGESRELEIKGLGSMRIACSFSSYCGQTDVLSTSHRLYAVTDRTGHFRIEGVPLDQDLVVHAWQPLFAESRASVRLTSGAPEKQVTLKLAPQDPAAADQVAPPPTGPTKRLREGRAGESLPGAPI